MNPAQGSRIEAGSKETVEKLVRKPIELICCAPDQQLTFVQRRILTAVCAAVAANRSEDVAAFTPRSLDTAIGNKGNNLGVLHQAAMEMLELKAWHNPLEAGAPPTTGRMFTSVSSSKSEIRFSLEPDIAELIRHGDSYAEVDPDIEKHLGGCNALALYELSVFFLRRRLTPVQLPAVRWRQLLTGSSNLGPERFVKAKLLKKPADVLAAVAGFRPIVLAPSNCKRGYIGITIRRLNGEAEPVGGVDLKVCSDPEASRKLASGQPVSSPVLAVDDSIKSFDNLLTSWNALCAAQRAQAMDGAANPGVEPVARTEGGGQKLTKPQNGDFSEAWIGDVMAYLASRPYCAQEGWAEIVAQWLAVRGELASASEALRRAEANERAVLVEAVRALIRAHGLESSELHGRNVGEASGLGSRADAHLPGLRFQ